MFNIDVRSNKPIYEQLVEQIKTGVIKGYLKNDDLLPSVRKMAINLGVNPNTVAKAYQELERQGIIATIRGKGTIISYNNQIIEKDISRIMDKIKPLVVELKYAGKTTEEIINEIKKICDDLGGNL